jgi:CelD/BcsL family acetyltransferase involved in cellulose biosynthesis
MLEAVIPSQEIAPKTATSSVIQAVIKDWGEFQNSDFIVAWKKLTAQGVCCEPFYQPEWFHAFQVSLAPKTTPYLVTVHRGGDLVGLLPLMRGTHVLGRIPATCLQSLSNLHSCRFDFVHDGTARESVSRAAWECVRDRGDWDVIEGRDVPMNGNFEGLMERARTDRFPTLLWPTRKMPYLPLSVDGQDPFKNCPERFKGSRSRLKGKEKKLRQEGAVDFTLTREADPEILGKFLKLEASGWKGQNGSAISLSSSLVNFYTTIAKVSERQGTLRLYSLRLCGEPIAMHFGLHMNGVYYIPKVAYDERYKKFSPGLLLAKYVIEALTQEGISCFDFLGPRMEWKCVWTPYAREHANCYIFNRTVKGRALHAAVKATAHLRRLKYRWKGDPQEI